MATEKFRGIDALYNPEPEDSVSKRRGINSVETGVGILEVLISMRGPSTLTSIAEASGLDTSQAHRYMSSLLNTGLVRQDRHSGLYGIGEKALQFGLTALNCLDPINEVSDAARDMAHIDGFTTLVAIWSPNGPIIVRWYAGRPPVHTSLTVGSILPLTSSATGMVFLAFLESNYLESQLIAEGYEPPAESNRKLKKIQSDVSSTCVASVDSALIPGLRAYAAPVFGAHNSLLSTVTVVASDSMAKSVDERMKKRLMQVCAELTQKLGGQWPLDNCS